MGDHKNIPSIAWSKLWESIRKTTPGTEILSKSAYVHSPDDRIYIAEHVESRLLHTLQASKFNVVRSDQDIGKRIIIDMHLVLLRQLKRALQLAGFGKSEDAEVRITLPLKCRFILVSGDAQYISAFKDLKEFESDILSFELDVWAWKGNLDSGLEKYATRTFPLDKFLGTFLESQFGPLMYRI
jgi:hypothetical protein